jgi:CelD/BcsL family acetyltransferase involved in cellulose biosynthesis
MHVVEYHSLEAAGELREAWNALLAVTPDASFCQSWDWISVHGEHVAGTQRPLILSVVEAGEVIGILPLAVVLERRKLGLLRVLKLAGDSWVSFSGPVSRDPQQMLSICFEHLKRRVRNYDLLELSELRIAPMRDASPSKLPVEPRQPVALIDLVGDWESYRKGCQAKSNRWRNIERCERRLAQQGTIEYVRHRPRGTAHGDDDPRWDLFEACQSVAQLSWQSGLTDGNTLSHDSVREFLKKSHQTAARCGALDMNVLLFDGRPLAFLYGYHYRGYLDLIRAGFHPDFAKLAPGNALWTRLIRDSFARGDRVLDMGRGFLDYKQVWLTRIEPQQRLSYYPPTAWGQTLRMAHWLRRRFPTSSDTNQRSKEMVAAQRHTDAVDSQPTD